MANLLTDIKTLCRMPRVVVDLMLRRTKVNDPFYASVVKDFHKEATARHPKLPLCGRMTIGVALCRLPAGNGYEQIVEASAMRNLRKAERLGYRFEKINFAEHVSEIAAIRKSTDFRQGRVPDSYLSGAVEFNRNPLSKTTFHDYLLFGAQLGKDLHAYMECFVAGEICMIEHVLGHAAHQDAGIVPLMIVRAAEYVAENHPAVKYYCYGTYFGSRESMKRFKRKFGFTPHKVKWLLDDARGKE